LDLYLWFGPRLKLSNLISSSADRLQEIYQFQDPEMVNLLASMRELWVGFAEQFNLSTALRSYPVGIPSLMVSRTPVAAPIGAPIEFEFAGFSGALGAWLLITLVGLLSGTLFFILVSQAALEGNIQWRKAIDLWPRSSVQIFFFALLLAGLVLIASIPGGLILSLIAFGGASFGQCALLIYSGFVLWLILPLVFTPHGIIINQDNLKTAVIASATLLRKTLPATILFLLVIFLLSKGLDILWLIPADNSWLLFIGILGHGFVATSLLASSFVYYRDSTIWMLRLVQTGRFS
jgi:hypothetical protein